MDSKKGEKRLKTARKGLKCQKWVKSVKMGRKNGEKQLKVAKGFKLAKRAERSA